MDPYKILDIEQGATAEEIELAFRRKSAQWHPDRLGNNPEKLREAHEAMIAINEAYKILSDDKRRREFDEHGGDAGGPDSVRTLARGVVKQLFQQFLDADQLGDNSHNPFEMFALGVGQRMRRDADDIIKLRARIRRLDKIEKRLRRRDRRQPSLLKSMVEQNREAALESIKQKEKDIEIGTEALKLMEQYDYDLSDCESTPRALPAALFQIGFTR